jgi:hypothetical protein
MATAPCKHEHSLGEAWRKSPQVYYEGYLLLFCRCVFKSGGDIIVFAEIVALRNRGFNGRIGAEKTNWIHF